MRKHEEKSRCSVWCGCVGRSITKWRNNANDGHLSVREQALEPYVDRVEID